MSNLSRSQSSAAEAFFLTSGNSRTPKEIKEAADSAMGKLLVLVKTSPEKVLSVDPVQFADPDVRGLLDRLQRQAAGTVKRRDRLLWQQNAAFVAVDRRTAAVLQS
jgi:hypothetical protein